MPVWFSSSHLKVSLLLPALSILITMFPAGAEFLFLVPTASSLDFWLSHEECLLWSFIWKNSLHKPKMPITRQPVAYNSRPGEVCCWHKGLNERQMWTNRPCGQRVRVQASTNRRHFRKDFMLHRKGKEWTRRNALAKGNGEALTKRTGKTKIKMTCRESQNCMKNFTQELYSLIKRTLNQRGGGGRREDEKVGIQSKGEVTCSRPPAIPDRSFAQTASESLRAFFWSPLRSLHPAFRRL